LPTPTNRLCDINITAFGNSAGLQALHPAFLRRPLLLAQCPASYTDSYLSVYLLPQFTFMALHSNAGQRETVAAGTPRPC